MALLSCAGQPASIPSSETPAADAQAGGQAPIDAAVAAAADAPVSVDDAKKYADQRPRPDTYVPHEFPTFHPPPCASTKSILCDDFESGAMNPKWHVGFDRLVVDSTRAHGGSKYALHAKASKASASSAWISITDIFPMPKNKFYLRAFLWIAGPPPQFNYNLFGLSGRPKGANQDSLFGVAGVTDPWGDPNGKRVSVLGGPDHSGKVGNVPITFDRWSCWEWEVNGETNEWSVWVEEELHMQLSQKNIDKRWLVPNLSQMTIELQQKDEPSPVEVWFDDLVVAQERVGCGSQ